jgi:plastocyanin
MKPKLFGLALFLLSGLFVYSSQASSGVGIIKGKVSIEKDGAPKKDFSGVVLYLTGAKGTLPVMATPPKITQKDKTFLPSLTVVTKGTTIEFPNEDKIFHNVFSVSSPAKFDLGLYKSGTTKSVTFKEAGVVDVYCNIHPEMVAKVKVIDSAYYAVTKADGAFELSGVPTGKYPITAWQASGDEWHGEVEVTDGGTATLTISLVEGKSSKKHLRKDGTPYGRYQ